MWRAARRDRSLTVMSSLYHTAGRRPARTCLPCRPPSTERCLVFCSPVFAPSAFVSRGRLFETGAAGAGEAAGSAIVVMVRVAGSWDRSAWRDRRGVKVRDVRAFFFPCDQVIR